MILQTSCGRSSSQYRARCTQSQFCSWKSLNNRTSCFFLLPVFPAQGTDAKGEKSDAHVATIARENGKQGTHIVWDVLHTENWPHQQADLICGYAWLCLLRRLISGLWCSPNCWGRSSVSKASHRLHEAKSRVFCLNWLCSVQRGNFQRTWSVGSCSTSYIICFCNALYSEMEAMQLIFFFTSRPGGIRSSEQTPSSPHCNEKVQLWSSSCSSLSCICSQSNKRNSSTVSRDSR